MTIGGSRQGRRWPRRILALAIPGLALIGVLAAAPNPLDAAAILKAAYARLSPELEDWLQTREPAIPARIVLGPAGRDVRLSGEIGDGAAARLAHVLDANPAVERVHLTSEGGLVDEAAAMGDLIAARGLVTYVPDYCVSACTLAFVRGRERYLLAGGRLGFHAPYDPGLFGEAFQADGDAERRAYVAAGVEAGFAAQAVAVPSQDIWLPDAARLIEARVITGSVDTYRFPDSTLDADASRAAARATVLRVLPPLGALESTATGVIDRTADWYRDAYRAGRSEGETLDGLGRLAVREAERAMPHADDAAAPALGRFLLQALHGAAAKDPAGACCADLIRAYDEALARPNPAAALRAVVRRHAPPTQEASALP